MIFSVIVPVYNLEQYINTTLECFADMGNDSELIIVNDGSTDNSLKMAKEFVERNPSLNIKLIDKKNSGVSAARNEGIKNSSGEYLIFADGDDLCRGDMLKVLADNISDNCDMLVWRYGISDKDAVVNSQKEFEKSEYIGWEFAESFLRGKNKIRIGSFAVKKTVLDKTGTFTEGCAICEDIEFIYKALISSDIVRALNDVLYTYVKRAGSAINTFDMKRFQAPRAIERVYEFACEQAEAANKQAEEYSLEYILDSTHYGLYITHSMFCFESCLRFIDRADSKNEFLRIYYEEYADIEQNIKKAFKAMKYRPEVFSRNRLMLFKLGRGFYTNYLYKRLKWKRKTES